MILPASIPHDPWDAAQVWRWYSTRLAKGAHPVACELELIEARGDDGELLGDQVVIVRINGEESRLGADWPRGWPWHAIPEDEYRYLSEAAAWARTYDPASPMAQPHRRVSIDEAPIPTFERG